MLARTRYYSCLRTRRTRTTYVRHYSRLALLSSTLLPIEHKDSLPPLSAAQITKLKHLTIVSLAAERRVCLCLPAYHKIVPNPRYLILDSSLC